MDPAQSQGRARAAVCQLFIDTSCCLAVGRLSNNGQPQKGFFRHHRGTYSFPGETPLMAAVLRGHLEVARVSFSCRSRVGLKHRSWFDGGNLYREVAAVFLFCNLLNRYNNEILMELVQAQGLHPRVSHLTKQRLAGWCSCRLLLTAGLLSSSSSSSYTRL